MANTPMTLRSECHGCQLQEEEEGEFDQHRGESNMESSLHRHIHDAASTSRSHQHSHDHHHHHVFRSHRNSSAVKTSYNQQAFENDLAKPADFISSSTKSLSQKGVNVHEKVFPDSDGSSLQQHRSFELHSTFPSEEGNGGSPKRTDYTYSYSASYRRKNPSPKVGVPLMSRRPIHRLVNYVSSSLQRFYEDSTDQTAYPSLNDELAEEITPGLKRRKKGRPLAQQVQTKYYQRTANDIKYAQPSTQRNFLVRGAYGAYRSGVNAANFIAHYALLTLSWLVYLFSGKIVYDAIRSKWAGKRYKNERQEDTFVDATDEDEELLRDSGVDDDMGDTYPAQIQSKRSTKLGRGSGTLPSDSASRPILFKLMDYVMRFGAATLYLFTSGLILPVTLCGRLWTWLTSRQESDSSSPSLAAYGDEIERRISFSSNQPSQWKRRCGWLFWCILLPLMLLLLPLLLCYYCPPETKEKYYRQYVEPMPDYLYDGQTYVSTQLKAAATKSYEAVNSSMTYLSSNLPDFRDYSFSWPNRQQEVKPTFSSDYSRLSSNELKNLEAQVIDLRSQLTALTQNPDCCQKTDFVALFSPHFESMLSDRFDEFERKLQRLYKPTNDKVNDLAQESEVIRNEAAKLKLELSAVSGDLSQMSIGQGQIDQFSKKLSLLESAVDVLKATASAKSQAGDSDSKQTKELNEKIKALEYKLEASDHIIQDIQAELKALKEQQAKGELDLDAKVRRPASGNTNVNLFSNKEEIQMYIDSRVNSAINNYDVSKAFTIADHALEPAGGAVINIRCTETYSPQTRRESLLGIIPLWYKKYSPRTVIQPGVVPGECWAFKGSHGFLLISLSGLTQISNVSIEHIPVTASPEGHIQSAPKDMQIFGLSSESEIPPDQGTWLANATYDKNGHPLQFFQVQNKNAKPVRFVELRVLNNHGHPTYTCLYRFGVHGKRIGERSS